MADASPIGIANKRTFPTWRSTKPASSVPWMYLLCGYSVLIIGLAVHSSQALPRHQLHQHMTLDEIKSIFRVDSHLQVPDYDVVHVRSLRKREAGTPRPTGNESSATVDAAIKEIHISAFGRHYPLRLQRNDHLSRSADRLKVFVAEMHTDGNLNLTEVHFPGNTSDIGEVYQDDVSGAAVLVHHEADGTLLLDGTIGSGLAIKPAPVSVLQPAHHHELPVYPDDEMYLDNELPPDTPTDKQLKHAALEAKIAAGGRTTPRTKGLHIVYESKQSDSSASSDYMFMEPDRISPVVSSRQRRSEDDQTRRRREAPVAVWPEILVIVDYDTYSMHGSNNMDIKRYFISFWNGVDLRYKLLGTPKVRISLAGIIISKGRDATPYLENNRVGGNAVDSAGALTELGKYLFRERRLPTYDIAVVVTKLDLCRREYTLGACNKGTAGFAYVGGACVVNKRLEKVNSVAIIEDTGGFSGIIVAAHEVGHLLGAVHDGSPPPSYLGGPGAEHCRWEDGYIMSDLRHTERGFKWSLCSVQQFKHFLNGDTAKCLYNIPHEDDELPRLLPGKLLSLDSQCRKDRGTSACFKDDRVCAQLFCFDSRSGYCVSYRPAAEGSPCGDGQYCINGRCVAENENVIPDYSRVSEIRVPKPDSTDNEVSTLGESLDDTHSNAAGAGTAEHPDSSSSDRFGDFPRRTAVLDNEDDISVVDGRSGRREVDSVPQPPQVKRTLVLDDGTEDGQVQRSDKTVDYSPEVQSHEEVQHDSKRTSELDEAHADELLPVDRTLSRSSTVGEIGEDSPRRQHQQRLRGGSAAFERAYGGEGQVRREAVHLRRTSHLDAAIDDLLAFSEESSTPGHRNTVVKHDEPRQPFIKHDLNEHDLNSDIGCRDIMRELAGGLTCKQFLRRFGDRYCNHHYIIANCCSSRKIICDI